MNAIMDNLREKQQRREDIISRSFREVYERLNSDKPATLVVCEAPAAEAWVVIADDEAWVATSDRDEFVFWGPLGKKPVSFNPPVDW